MNLTPLGYFNKHTSKEPYPELSRIINQEGTWWFMMKTIKFGYLTGLFMTKADTYLMHISFPKTEKKLLRASYSTSSPQLIFIKKWFFYSEITITRKRLVIKHYFITGEFHIPAYCNSTECTAQNWITIQSTNLHTEMNFKSTPSNVSLFPFIYLYHPAYNTCDEKFLYIFRQKGFCSHDYCKLKVYRKKYIFKRCFSERKCWIYPQCRPSGKWFFSQRK